MAGLGPWPADRRVAVAVSGGADSLCLAWLAAAWGKPFGLIVDHGLRPDSAAEAELTRIRLAAFDVDSRVLRLTGLARGPALAARARRARYAALTEAASQAGLSDLLLGHHAGDQAETIMLRRDAHSGAAGLAGMARIVETPALRLIRPMLAVPPGRLRATLRIAGIDWVEDPSNADPAAARTRARMALAAAHADAGALIAHAGRAGQARVLADGEIARVLAERAVIRPEGWALLSPGPIDRAAFTALVRALTGSAYPARTAGLLRMAACPQPGVIGGIRVLAAGRLGEFWILAREPAAMAEPVAALPNALWDDRFRLHAAPTLPDGATLGALGRDAAQQRHRTPLPACVLQTLPAIRVQGRLVAVPHLGYAEKSCFAGIRLGFSPLVPASGAPFGA